MCVNCSHSVYSPTCVYWHWWSQKDYYKTNLTSYWIIQPYRTRENRSPYRVTINGTFTKQRASKQSKVRNTFSFHSPLCQEFTKTLLSTAKKFILITSCKVPVADVQCKQRQCRCGEEAKDLSRGQEKGAATLAGGQRWLRLPQRGNRLKYQPWGGGTAHPPWCRPDRSAKVCSSFGVYWHRCLLEKPPVISDTEKKQTKTYTATQNTWNDIILKHFKLKCKFLSLTQ